MYGEAGGLEQALAPVALDAAPHPGRRWRFRGASTAARRLARAAGKAAGDFAMPDMRLRCFMDTMWTRGALPQSRPRLFLLTCEII